jgi:transposase
MLLVGVNPHQKREGMDRRFAGGVAPSLSLITLLFSKRPERIPVLWARMTSIGSEKMTYDTLSTTDAQSIGVDISKATLDTHAYPVGQASRFPNTPNGFKALLKWLTAFDVIRVVFEPTGAYHHDFERALGNAGIALCKINPLQARRYAQSRGKRAKTDAVDALMLARMGHEHGLKPKPILSQAIDEMKELSVARLALIKDRTAAMNRKHVRRSALLQRQCKARLTQINKQIEEIDVAIAAIIATQPDLKEKEKILLSIPGIGPAAVRALIIDMPELGTIDNAQAASLVGVAPIPKESGAYKGQSRIGGGRAHVRQALYMPALVACRYNPDLKAKYDAMIKADKPKKKAIIAILRKLVVLANALLSKGRLWTPKPA